ncbi:MAG: YdcF family protein [Pyrinomonadaceae bacterium]|nr:YdcF family protein [Blastocatellia bacterium]MCW5957547.1 YdcF family protein [Pyrinomonadaceae bacterium]
MKKEAKANTKGSAGDDSSFTKKWWIRFSTGLGIILFLWMILAWFLSNFLVLTKPLEKADYILVLSGASAYRERVMEASRLFHLGITQKILLTDDGVKGGWDAVRERNPYFVERAKWLLEHQGVPESAIEVLPRAKGDGTVWEAELVADVVKERHVTSLLVVTSTYHSRRAIWIFEKVFEAKGLQPNLGVASPLPQPNEPPAFDWWLSRHGWSIVATEYSKYLYYWFKF